MLNIDYDNLNPLEKKINEIITERAKSEANLTITAAAEACQCSTSKISKFVKKLGFTNYKQYMDFLNGREIPPTATSTELTRIQSFIEGFDLALVDEFIEQLYGHDRIILFGYGPSFICAQYLEYKLRINSNKFVIAVQDEISVESMLDDRSLLVIFSTTGKFRSFDHIKELAAEKASTVLLVVEEYNSSLLTQYEKILWLSPYPQSDELRPYEKTRTVFFIFIEEVILRMVKMNAEAGPGSI